MNFAVLPPEVNSWRVHAGPGPGSMLAAEAAWAGLATELRSAASEFGSIVSDLSSDGWQGSSSVAMTDVAATHLTWLRSAATEAEQAAAQARATAQAFESMFSATVHPAAVASNRARLMSLASSNLFGQNASAIAAVESEYGHMWAQDVTAMAGYHAAASAAGEQLTPWQHLQQSLAAPASTTPGETRITVPSNAPDFLFGNETPQQYAALNKATGANWFPGTTPKVVNYPATAGLINGLTAPTADRSLVIGQRMLNADILAGTANGQSVVVAGLSEGSIVIDREEAYLTGLPGAPLPSQVTFVEFANPERGIAQVFLPVGTHVAGLGYTAEAPPVTPYNTEVVYRQYEGFSDFPNRPWHLLSDLNALAGTQYLHLSTALVSQSQAVQVSSVTNSLGGTTTTYMIPTATLPMLIPLQQIGVPAPIVHNLNSFLTPIVNEGYSQYDPSGGAYLSRGHLVW
jgi:PPE-repeat protein